ncbi:PAT16 [Symbiodinium sp. CCMP2592]|nr:PAT16 [Symbiodinium sp. CCMP2592]
MGDIYASVSYAGLSWTSPHALTFRGTFVLAAISWQRAVVEDPGRVPEDWRISSSGQPIFEKEGGLHFPKKRTSPGGRRYFCRKEGKFRPERAHFCSVLDRNVLRMDHYCVWLANCVGYHNHKYFYLALFYSAVASTVGNAVLVQAFLHPSHLPVVHRVILLPGTLLSSLLLAMLWPYLGFHTFLIGRNLTTIEFLETRDLFPGFSKYDEGLYSNIQCVLGDSWPLWLLPMAGPSGTGLEWGVAETQTEGFLSFTKLREDDDAPAEELSSRTAASSASGEQAAGFDCMTRWATGGAMALEVLACDSWQSLSQTVAALASYCGPLQRSSGPAA